MRVTTKAAIIVLALALTACTQPTVTPNATLAPTPDFIMFIAPMTTDQKHMMCCFSS